MSSAPSDWVLASTSPRRKALLEQLGLLFETLAAPVDEAVRPGELPLAYVLRMAQEKALAAQLLRPRHCLLAADTAVILDDAILGKPTDRAHAKALLKDLSGRTHRVLTSVAALSPRGQLELLHTDTEVSFRAVSSAEINWYVNTGEPLDKAGAYAIQGIGAAFVTQIKGSYTGVVGLPLPETLGLLRKMGLAWP